MSRISEDQLWVDYIDNQMTMRAISAKYQIGLGAVHDLISIAGIPARKAGRRSSVTPQLRARIIAMRKRKESMLHIAAALRLDRTTVWKVLCDEGLNRRIRCRRAA